MKQHITVEQVWELSKHIELDGEPEWNSIVNFNTFMGYDWNLTEEENKKYTFKRCCEDTAKWTTIGKMIEMLDDYHSEIFNTLNIYKNHFDEWCIEVDINTDPILLAHNDELCDALWEAVKRTIDEFEG